MAKQKSTVKVNKTETTFSSYAEIKRNMKLLLDRSLLHGNIVAQVTVFRSKRGYDGTWFEVWQYNKNNKPVIINSGWIEPEPVKEMGWFERMAKAQEYSNMDTFH